MPLRTKELRGLVYAEDIGVGLGSTLLARRYQQIKPKSLKSLWEKGFSSIRVLSLGEAPEPPEPAVFYATDEVIDWIFGNLLRIDLSPAGRQSMNRALGLGESAPSETSLSPRDVAAIIEKLRSGVAAVSEPGAPEGLVVWAAGEHLA